jgi:hypothetical protein
VQYKPETFEALAHQQTVDKLVKHFGYPKVPPDLACMLSRLPARLLARLASPPYASLSFPHGPFISPS